LAIIFVATPSSEGNDRVNLSLANGQDELIHAVSQVQENTIVVTYNPGSVLMPWHDEVKGILAAFYPGQEGGNAIADILFGDINPTAKLPVTFPLTENDTVVADPEAYPGINNVALYKEKLQVGYRWFDAQNKAPLFEFGFGLSYTSFKYDNLLLSAR